MLEVLLIAQLSCSHLSNYVITPGVDCINLSPVFHGDSSTNSISESSIIDGVGKSMRTKVFSG